MSEREVVTKWGQRIPVTAEQWDALAAAARSAGELAESFERTMRSVGSAMRASVSEVETLREEAMRGALGPVQEAPLVPGLSDQATGGWRPSVPLPKGAHWRTTSGPFALPAVAIQRLEAQR